MTMAEKILAAHAGLDEVEPGQLIECDLDLVLANDITAPIAIKTVREITDKVFDPTKIALVPDHYTPNKDIKSAEQAKIVRDFVREQGITHYYEVGCMGVEHALLPEQGVVGAGDLIIGADSHTCTYGALGAFSTGVGSTDAGVGMATGKAWFKVPETIRFEIDGELPEGGMAFASEPKDKDAYSVRHCFDTHQLFVAAPDHALHVGNIRCTAHVGLHVGERKPDHVAQELLVGNNQYSVHVLPPALPAASAAPKTVPEAHRGKKNCRMCCL